MRAWSRRAGVARSRSGRRTGRNVPDRARTYNLRLRRPTLYPIELREPNARVSRANLICRARECPHSLRAQARRRATIDDQRLTGHEAGAIGIREEEDCFTDFAGF